MPSIFSKQLLVLSVLCLNFYAFAQESQTIYRSVLGSDYMFSASPTEGPKAKHFPDEARFTLLKTEAPNTLPIYRCHLKTNALSHFLSRSATCEDQVVEKLLGYIFLKPDSKLKALNRYVNKTTNNHVDLIEGDEVNFKGWSFEGIQGYVTELPLPVVTQTKDDGKKYFGYFAGAMDNVGTGDYIPELAKISNLIFIKSTNNFEQKLIECEKLGLKATITFDWLFFDSKLHLNENYAEDFAKIEPIVRKHLSTIVAFYGLDEPYNNSAWNNVDTAEAYNAQETMGRFLKSKFPEIPIAVIFTTFEINKNLPLFPSFDWYGFDCYSASMSCAGQTVDWLYENLNRMVNELTAKDHKKRFLIAVPQAGRPVTLTTEADEKTIVSQIPIHKNYIKKYPNLKLVMPFIWQSYNDGASNWIGAREMPEAKAAYELFYKDYMKQK